jgi:hypothetical protein
MPNVIVEDTTNLYRIPRLYNEVKRRRNTLQFYVILEETRQYCSYHGTRYVRLSATCVIVSSTPPFEPECHKRILLALHTCSYLALSTQFFTSCPSIHLRHCLCHLINFYHRAYPSLQACPSGDSMPGLYLQDTPMIRDGEETG